MSGPLMDQGEQVGQSRTIITTEQGVSWDQKPVSWDQKSVAWDQKICFVWPKTTFVDI